MKFPSTCLVAACFLSLSAGAAEETPNKNKKLNLKPLNVTSENPNAAFHLLKKEPGNSMEKKFKSIGKESSPVNCSDTNMGGGNANHAVACSRTIESKGN